MRQALDDLHVCSACFEDENLKLVVGLGATSPTCSFCGATAEEPIAAPVREVAEYMYGIINTEYDDPANWLPWEGEYIGSTFITDELFRHEIGLDLTYDDDRLLDALIESVEELRSANGLSSGPAVWCERNPFALREPEQLRLSWDSFSSYVKHGRRYFFRSGDLPAPEDPSGEILTPDELFTRIAGHVTDLGLIRSVPQGARTYRARFQPAGVRYATGADLGPPTPEKAKENRMSPAGIVMFYSCDDVETAVRETRRNPGDYAVGEFVLLRNIRILDLSEIPAVPSFWDETRGWERNGLRFLHAFAKEISRPVLPDQAPIEYVPTQVLTEYFRTQFKYEDEPIDGIAYESSRNPGHRSYVLFATQSDIRGAARADGQTGEGPRVAPVWLDLIRVQVVRSGLGLSVLLERTQHIVLNRLRRLLLLSS